MAYLRILVLVTGSLALCGPASAQVLTSSTGAPGPGMPRLTEALVPASPRVAPPAPTSVAVKPAPIPAPVAMSRAPAPSPGPAAQPPRAPDSAPDLRSDHDRVVSRLGIGWEGLAPNVIEAQPGAGGLGGLGTPPSGPMIGVRYWLSNRLGLDVAVGLALSAGGGSTSGVEEEDPPTYIPTSTGFLLRVGVPWVLYARSHYTFLAQAHVLTGYSRSVTTTELDDGFEMRETKTVRHSFRVDATATAGAEIHFGFIGIPELSLQGTVGLGVTHTRSIFAREGRTTRSHGTVLATTLGNAPWDFFRTAVAARYYF